MGLKRFQVSHSWKPSHPTEMVPALGDSTTMGVWAMLAVATAVTKFVTPGPFWPMTTPALPVRRQKASSMWPAVCSWRTEMKSMPAAGNRSRRSMKAEPRMPPT